MAKQTAAAKKAAKTKEAAEKGIFKEEEVNLDQKGRILELKYFDLVSFKNNKTGIELVYYNSMLPDEKVSLIVKGAPHPDLQKKMDELKYYLAKIWKLIEGWEFAMDNSKGNLDAVKEAKAKRDLAVSETLITGLTFKGDGEAKGVMIKGYCGATSSGASTRQITFADDSLGYEEDIEAICKEISEEVYKYKFGRKRAQMDLMQQAEEAEQYNEESDLK